MRTSRPTSHHLCPQVFRQRSNLQQRILEEIVTQPLTSHERAPAFG